jgi:hypothetical protein
MICLYSGVGENQQQLRKAKSSSGPAEWVNWEPPMKGGGKYVFVYIYVLLGIRILVHTFQVFKTLLGYNLLEVFRYKLD